MLKNYLTWSQWRPVLLGAILGAIAIVSGRMILYPYHNQHLEQPLSFPQTVPLTGWKFLAGKSIQKENQYPDFLGGYQYQYQQDKIQMEIQMRYIINSEGNISRLLNLYTPIQSRLNLQEFHQDDVGFYGGLVNENRTYLTACINPRGKATLTQQQFMRNRYFYDLQPNRLALWLLGQNDFFDQRCLFTVLSIRDVDSSLLQNSKTFRALEYAWFSWHEWWKSHFSQL